MNIINSIKNAKNSIFTKLILITIFSWVLIHLLVINSLRLHFKEPPHKVVIKYSNMLVNYIIEDIGNPPSVERARELTDDFDFSLKISGNNFFWESKKIDIPFEHIEYRKYKNSIFKWHHGFFIFITQKNNYNYRFIINRPFIIKSAEKVLFIIFISLIGIMVFNYYLIRLILNPIKMLSRGVELVSSGVLTHKIPVKKKDELGKLTSAFNRMSNHIYKMLKAREQLLLDVSHELRSPITRVKVALEFLENSEIKSSIKQDVLELESMITEILESENLKNDNYKISKENISIKKLFSDVLNSLKINDKYINYTFEDAILNVDIKKFKIVIKNIIENSKKYSPMDKHPVVIKHIRKNSIDTLEICDHGKGIPDKDLEFIFEPFYRVDRSRNRHTGGYGLGLHICKKIIDAHEGTISINSRVDKGTTIRITLPV